MRKNANSFKDKGVRGDPLLLQSIQRRTPSAAGDCEAHHVPGGTILTPGRGKKQRTPHYWPTLFTIPPEGEEPEPTYAVTVTTGWLREIKTGSGDALAYHKAENHFEETDPPAEAPDPKTYTDKLAKHPIEPGQSVYITAQIDADGRVAAGESEEETNPVEIEVADDEEASIQYQPKVYDGNPNGASGTLRFKLATLEEPESEGAAPKLKPYLAGDHIHWTPPLPAFLSTWDAGEGVGIVFKEWLDSANAYRVRAITQKDPVEATSEPPAPAQEVQIHVVQEPNRIIIKGNSKNRKVKYKIGAGDTYPVVSFDDGLETEGVEGGNELIIPIPEVIGRDDPQVTVTPVAAGYQVEGNGKDGSLSVGGSPVAEWIDGLMLGEGDTDIDVPDGLPDGVNGGDMLYWTGEEWALVSAPTFDDSGKEWVLHITAGLPEWIQYDNVTVNICVSGTPTEYTILGIPTPPL